MPAHRKYSEELVERAVRAVADRQCQTPGRRGIIREVGESMGIHPEVLRHWVKKTEAQTDLQDPLLPSEANRLHQLEQENADLRRTNEILETIVTLFAAVLKPTVSSKAGTRGQF
ncbi:transposase [Streptomyces pathocidini]|uniref:Transposase n=1 Tax=Streptomyces pathocidini TaxID=1650571 RepID=A0ABW7V0K1_9ACTN|nr:transposase [Streptomyces pathocidini]